MNLTTILENSSDAILVLSREWELVEVNPSAERLFRRKRADLSGKNFWSEYPDLLGTPAEAAMRLCQQSQRPQRFEQFIPGLYAWHSVLAVPNPTEIVLFCRDISDRVRALRDAAVREGMRSIVENVPVAITITRGREHRIDLQNVMSRQLLNGRNVEGMTLVNALPEVATQGFLAILDSVYASGLPFDGQGLPFAYRRDDSGEMYSGSFDVTYQPIFDTHGKIEGILHMGVDVTESVEKQQLLTRYAAERDAIFEQLTEGIILTDAVGRITFVNQTASRLHGVAALDVDVDAYASTYHLFTEDGLPFPPTELPLARAVLRDEVVINARWLIRRADGTEIRVEGSAQPVFDAARTKIACVLIIRECP